MLIAREVAVVDHGNHVRDGKRQQIGAHSKRRPEIQHDATGLADVRLGLGELMQTHFAVLQHEARGETDTIAIGQKRLEIPWPQAAVFEARLPGLLAQPVGEAVFKYLDELRRAHAAELVGSLDEAVHFA